jgi:MFS family permease
MTASVTGSAGRPPRFSELRALTGDGRLLFATRMVRLFAYGFLSVVLVLYLSALGHTDSQIGLLLTLTLLGDAVISLWISTQADRIGRKRMLMAGSALMILAGVLFVVTRSWPLLVIAATIGVISPSGNEVGPFLALEQAALSHTVPDRQRTGVFAWYNLAGSVATAVGALAGGGLAQLLQSAGWAAADSYKVIVLGYAVMGAVLVLIFLRLSSAIEAEVRQATPGLAARFLGLHQSRGTVLKLSGLFALDSFAGGFVVQSVVAYWFHRRFGVEPAVLGSIFFGANVLAGLSALSAAWVARRVGLLNTMVVTHLPSNVLLILVPLMPSLPLAIAMLLLRFSISQMDVPTRQSYTMAVVPRGERAAAAGVTGIARTLGAAVSPALAVALMANPMLMAAPFLISGGLKIIYDLLVYATFRNVKPPEEA